MKKNLYEFPKSSFLAITKDTSLIMRKILNNKDLLKLFYYTTKDWKKQPDLTSEQIKSLLDNKQISNIPKIQVNDEHFNYLRIDFDSFTPNATNPYYRDHVIEFKVICNFDNWGLDNYELRPFRIAGELDSMFNNSKLSGIGELVFMGATKDVYDDSFGGVSLRYLVINGNDDKINPLDE